MDATGRCPVLKLSYPLDSSASRISLDSIGKELSGHWQLIEMAGGWKRVAQKPLYKIEMILNQQSQGVIYQDGQFQSSFQLTLTYWWGWVRTTVLEQGEKPFLNFSPRRRGFLKMCEQFLILDQDVGDGDLFVFERKSSFQKKHD